jgi:hypothetical protein
MQHKLLILFSILLFSLSFTTNGQKLVNTPYARFNLGAIEPAGSFKSLGMGGIGMALRDNSSMFISNPASYSSIDTNSFVFDFGLDASINVLSDGKTSYTSDDINFDHLIMGFPITKGWGVVTGVVPLTSGYYKLYDAVVKGDPDYDPITGASFSYHSGEGGFNNFFFGTGVNITKKLSVGVNMRVLFGMINRSYTVNFTDFYNVFNNSATEKLNINGINFDYGIQYSAPLKNNYFLNAGVSVTTGKNYSTDYEMLTTKFTAYGNRDTILYVSDNTTPTYIPGTFRIGIALGKKNKFSAGFDFNSTKWSASKLPGLQGYAADTKSYLFGAEFIPDKYSNYSFMKRLEYRVGAHLGDNYLIIDGAQLKEYGASFGIGIPMSRTLQKVNSLSKTNFFFDYTRKYGPSSGNLPTENYYTIGISLNFYDFWFRKLKYD